MDVFQIGIRSEMAPHRVANVLLKRCEIIGLSEDRLANGAGAETSVSGFLNEKNDLFH